MESPLISSHNDQLKAENSQPKPSSKKGYVILPGHPFYGEEVSILQVGNTNTQAWCLIAHPYQEHFHYRLPLRWISDEPPEPLEDPFQQETHIILSPLALEKLVGFLNSLPSSINMPGNPQTLLKSQRINQPGDNNNANRPEANCQDLETNAGCSKEVPGKPPYARSSFKIPGDSSQ